MLQEFLNEISNGYFWPFSRQLEKPEKNGYAGTQVLNLQKSETRVLKNRPKLETLLDAKIFQRQNLFSQQNERRS